MEDELEKLKPAGPGPEATSGFRGDLGISRRAEYRGVFNFGVHEKKNS